MSFLDHVDTPTNFQDPPLEFIVDELFSKIDAVSKDNLGQFPNITARKVFIINQFISQYRTHVGLNMYPAARLILPNRDKRLFYIRETALVRLLVKAFHIPKHSIDYNKLVNWKRNYHNLKDNYGGKSANLRDLPLIASKVISDRRDPFFKVEKNITVNELNNTLDTLAQVQNSSDQVKIMQNVFNNMTIEQIRWYLTIVLKISTLSFFEKYFFVSWHPDALNLYHVCNNLEKTLNLLTDPEKRLTDSELYVQPMYPFLPQLSYKLTISYAKLIENMHSNFLIEEKMDGDRMVMHYKDFKFKFYSRRCKDYTLLYGENFQIGSLTKYLEGSLAKGVKSIVLDGEMVAYDYKRNVILPFGTLKSSAVQESVRQFNTTDLFDKQSSWPLFFIFDILHLNGKNLTNFPLSYRKDLIKKLIKPVPNKFEILQYKIGKDVGDIEDAIKTIISDRSEGVIIKNLNSKYHVAERNNCWIKIKPEYLEEFGENLDIVVVGLIPAIKNSYMCGFWCKVDNVFKSFCTVANGFTDDDYKKIDRLTSTKWKPFVKGEPTGKIEFGSKKPDFWIDPEDSIVLEIKARSIDNSVDKTYATGTTLHNLYCRGIRQDKSYKECITFQDYKELKLKYSKNFLKSQKVAENRRKLKKHGSSFLDQVSTKVGSLSSLFEGFRFLILSDKINQVTNQRIKISELKAIVKKYSGEIIQSPSVDDIGEKQVVIISEVLSPTCENYLKEGFDIIKADWIFYCVKNLTIVPLEPFLIYRSNNEALKELASKRVDQFQDSYTLIPNKPLVAYINELQIPLSGSVDQDDLMADFEEDGIDKPLYVLFRNLKFLIVSLDDDFVDRIMQTKIRQVGGDTTDSLSDCSFVVVPNLLNSPAHRDRVLAKVNQISKELGANYSIEENTEIPRIVVESFVDKSIEENILVDPKDYLYV